MPDKSELLFLIYEVARNIRWFTDQRARQYGMTRAQWAVLAKLERSEGLKQTELAELLDLQPITLTRQIDRLCDNGLIERRSDEQDRRVKRLYLLPAARPILNHLKKLRGQLADMAFSSMSDADAHKLLTQLDLIKQNIREAAGKECAMQKEVVNG